MTRRFFPYINRIMAIRRCPYCKAIIDESSEYCSNCGTQLLFPEDEFIEEEIPGEKIVDEEPEEEKPKRSKRKSSKKNEPLPEEKDEESAELKEDEDESVKPAEPIEKEGKEELVEAAEPIEEEEEFAEPPEPKEGEKDESEPSLEQAEQIESAEEPLAEGETDEKKEKPLPVTHPDMDERIKKEEEPIVEEEERQDTGEPLITPPEVREMMEEEGEAQKEFTFKTDELKRIVDPAEKEKQEIERFLDSIKKERGEKDALGEEILPDPSEIKKGILETEEELPPWAEKIKESSPGEVPFSEEEEEREEPLETEKEELPVEAEEPYEEKISPYDSEIDIQEGVDQESLPFDKEKREETKGISVRPFSRFSIWLKSRVFDLLFIGALWLVALWLASRLMEVPLFKLISASGLPVVIFYLVLLICYFFLFLYFMGETLGEHLFSQEK